MYLGIDVGASKTLLAIFDNQGDVKKELKFPTPANYDDFITEVDKAIKELGDRDFASVCCAIPGLIDHQKGLGKTFGNLAWHDVAIEDDLRKLLPGTTVLVENDAKIAAIYEAAAFKDEYSKVLYLTISTGIGAGVVSNGQLDPVLEDSEPGQMVLSYNGKLQKWESFASGRALVKKYGKKASEIDDPEIWREFSVGVAQGLDALLAIIQPDAVIIGGGVGAHLEKFQSFLISALRETPNNMVKIPPIVKAKRPEEAVIYGCYEYIRQKTA